MLRVAIISHYAPSLVRFRGEFIRTLSSLGHSVTALGPEAGFESALSGFGAQYKQIPLQRTGMNPLEDLHTIVALGRAIRDIEPDIVFSYAIKPVIYGSLAAWMAGVPEIYSMITGVGYVFTGESPRQRAVYRLIHPLYKWVLSRNKAVFFQNPDDLDLFKRLGLVLESQEQVVINGSGVDVSHFAFSPPPIEPISFLLVARLIRDKGIGEFVEAALQLKKRYPRASFRLLGPFDSNPTAISPYEVQKWEHEGIEYVGEKKDVRPYLAASSVFVLPSYREGTPRSVLEAMSMGRAIITTDAPGCRETVQDGVNGYLVPVKDAAATQRAMEQFILRPDLVAKFGGESRRIAVQKYDVLGVNRVILEAMGLLV